MIPIENWRFIDTGAGGAANNMAVDEALLESCKRGLSPPAIHLYTWERPAITIGYLQRLEKTVRMEECTGRGLEIVRRMTGGRAVVHNKDLGFSIVFPAKGKVIPSGLWPSYLKIARGFILGLKSLGLDTCLDNGRPSNDISIKARRESPACFLTRIRSEVVLSGRKLAGFAQRRMDDWALQQGTLMVDLDRRLWADLLNYTDGSRQEGIMCRLESEMISIRETSARDKDMPSIKNALVSGFSNALGVCLDESGLSDEEYALKCLLEKEKYKSLL
ncbi:lipoate--protein ligase family protein [bacterium]|nr:lipoate--protein ligase family protein [bacterium]